MMDTKREKRVHKLVLTGGPCGGKTTGQSRLSTFFENLGWKVFRVPETATVLLSGGIKFSDLSKDEGAVNGGGEESGVEPHLCPRCATSAVCPSRSSEAFSFQENLLRTMIQIENTFFELGKTCQKDCLIICDRGAMDASAFISTQQWERMMSGNNWNNVDLRDTRYNHIVHMVSAANGAENFYVTEDHACRSEGVELARELDLKAAASWIGHPYFDVMDNSTDFESKIKRMIACVCQKVGLDTGDRLLCNSRKLKFLVKGPLPPDSEFPPFQDFDVVHNYLQSANMTQARLRKRGQNNHWSYIHTIRRPQLYGQSVEVKTLLTHRDYNNMETQKDDSHFTIYKKRRCFILNNQYYQLDIYQKPCHPRCEGLMLLETYSAHEKAQLLDLLPHKLLKIEKEVTGEPQYSMFNLSLKADWKENQFGQERITNDKKDAKTSSTSCLNIDKSSNCSPKMPNGDIEQNVNSSSGKITNGIAQNSNTDDKSMQNANGNSKNLVNGNGVTSPSKKRSYGESPKEQNSNNHSIETKANGVLCKKLSPTNESRMGVCNGRN